MKTVIVATEVRMIEYEGAVWSSHPALQSDVFSTHLEVFDRVLVVGRVSKGQVDEDMYRVDRDGVRVIPLPFYSGLRGMVTGIPRAYFRIRALSADGSYFMGRLPEPISVLLFVRAMVSSRPFVSLVVSDPEQFGRSLYRGWRGQMLGAALRSLTQWIVARSSGVLYVTTRWLQQKYPAPPDIPVVARSNVSIDESAMVSTPRSYGSRDTTRLQLISIGSMSAPVKGFDVACKVVARLRAAGLDARLTVIGGGNALESVARAAGRLDLKSSIDFIGHVSSPQAVRNHLDAADIYLSTSRAEGLSRAMIEAMSRATPVVATRAGGVIELVPASFLADIDDDGALARIIQRMWADEGVLTGASTGALQRARELSRSTRSAPFRAFLQEVVASDASSSCVAPAPKGQRPKGLWW